MMVRFKRFSRRRFLRQASIGLGGLALAACQRAGIVTPASPTAGPSTPEANGDAHPQISPEPAQAVKRQGPLKPYGVESAVPITPNEDFYSVNYTGGDYPNIDAQAWRLEIAGLVERPLSLSLDDLKTMPQLIQMRTLECISNPVGGKLISNAVWRGVRLADVLDMAGVRGRALELKIEGADGYSTSIPFELGRHPDSLLAYEMNEEPLPRKNGFPVRCLFPGKYGQKQPKWIARIELIDEPYPRHWERQRWANDASVGIQSRIDRPASGERVAVGQPYEIGGIAFANTSGVQRLEVAAGKSGWADAELVRGPSNTVWVVWKYAWTPDAPGAVSIQARGTDGNGVAQTRDPEQAILGGTKPDGTSNIHMISATVVKGG